MVQAVAVVEIEYIPAAQLLHFVLTLYCPVVHVPHEHAATAEIEPDEQAVQPVAEIAL